VRRDMPALPAALVLCLGAGSCTHQAPTKSDCDDLAKVAVTLTLKDGVCVAAVPKADEHVCVVQGGAVRWRVHNKCKALLKKQRPAFEIANLKNRQTQQAPTWSFEGCSMGLDEVPLDEVTSKGQVLLCGVPETATVATYKYEIQGEEIETLDPDIEVRKGGN
jgi:hypothetical protein